MVSKCGQCKRAIVIPVGGSVIVKLSASMFSSGNMSLWGGQSGFNVFISRSDTIDVVSD